MLTVLIETLNDEINLAHCLAALVPAATEGIVREVIVVDHGSEDGTLIVADAAGCTIVEARSNRDEALRLAAGRARGDWLLFLPPSSVLPAGWQADVMAFVDRAMVEGRGMSAAGRFVRGRLVTGWRARLAMVRQWLTGSPREGGVLMSKAAWLALTDASPAFSASSVSGARRGAA